MKRRATIILITIRFLCFVLINFSFARPVFANNCDCFQEQFETFKSNPEDTISNMKMYGLLDSLANSNQICILLESDILYQIAKNRLSAYQVDSETIELLKRVLFLRGEIGMRDNITVKAHNNIAACYDQLMRPDLALSHTDSALIFYNESYNINTYVSTILFRANAQVSLSDYKAAISALLALEGAWDKEGIDKTFQIDWYFSLADVYTKVDSLEKAIYYYNEILKEDPIFIGPHYALGDLADLHRQKKNYKQATECVQQFKKYIDKNNERSLLRRYYSILGRIKNDDGEVNKSIEYHRLALKHPDVGFNPKYVIYENIAESFNKINQRDSSLLYYQKALTEMIGDYTTENLLEPPSLGSDFFVYCLSDIVEVLDLKSETLYEKFKESDNKSYLLASAAHYKTLGDLYSYIFKVAYSEQSKLLWTSKAKLTFEKAIGINFELYQLTGEAKYQNTIFLYAEQSKAIVLYQNLKNIDALSLIPKELQNEIDERKWQILKLENDYRRANAPEFREPIQVAKRELQNFIGAIEKDYPNFYEMKYHDNHLGITEVQKNVLKENELLLEIFEGSKQVYLIFITKKTVEIKRKQKSKKYSDAITSYQLVLSKKDSSIGQFKQSAVFLYQYFFEEGLAPYKKEKLVIIPDGISAKIPFDAFLTDNLSNEFSFKTAPYLIREIAVNYAYAVKTLRRTQAPIINAKALIVAPDYSQTRLAALNFAQKSASDITGLIKSSLLSGKEVTRKNCLEEFAKPHSIIHLAMHAERNDKSPLDSKLLFGSDELTVRELYNIKLQSNLAYLSACETGAGNIAEGEGVISLARAFKYSGCPNLVMTLWKVNDKSSYIISSKFYKKLLNGMDISESLSKAKTTYLSEADSERAHPFYWAGIISIGASNSVELASPQPPFTFILISILIIFILAVLFKNRASV